MSCSLTYGLANFGSCVNRVLSQELNDRNIHRDSDGGSAWMHIDYSVEK
jgi:hypothetical protein